MTTRRDWRKGLKKESKMTQFEWHDHPIDQWGSGFSYCNPSKNVKLFIQSNKVSENVYYSDHPAGTIVYNLRIYINDANDPIWCHPELSLDLELAKQDLIDVYYNLYPPLREK